MNTKVRLINGYELPNLCYGSAIVLTYKYSENTALDVVKYYFKNILLNRKQLKKDYMFPKIIDCAMNNGCNMFDTSRAYAGSEYLIGKALKRYKREDYHIVTKLCNSDQYTGNIRTGFEKSLLELNTDYIDLYLMHWPVEGHYVEAWSQIEELYKKGLCKAIGVCNCNIHHLEKLKKYSTVAPMVNQFECHPLFTQDKLREYCKQNNIQVMAYTSTARMDERLYKTVLVPIAEKYGKSITQIILRWHQQVGNIPIVNSSNIRHLIENTNINDFYLSDDEVACIQKINIDSRLRYDPDNCDFRKL